MLRHWQRCLDQTRCEQCLAHTNELGDRRLTSSGICFPGLYVMIGNQLHWFKTYITNIFHIVGLSRKLMLVSACGSVPAKSKCSFVRPYSSSCLYTRYLVSRTLRHSYELEHTATADYIRVNVSPTTQTLLMLDLLFHGPQFSPSSSAMSPLVIPTEYEKKTYHQCNLRTVCLQTVFLSWWDSLQLACCAPEEHQTNGGIHPSLWTRAVHREGPHVTRNLTKAFV